jgi:ABC-type siderophore export system fused ATPase/permease subunit
MSKKKMPYPDYQREREFLSKIEQSNYKNYEKTILTLSSAFLAFSISFLRLLKNNGAPLDLSFGFLLVLSWIAFGVSVISILINFLTSALALRKEVSKLEEALEDKEALQGSNIWTSMVYFLYAIAGYMFILGLVMLIIFSMVNFKWI